MHPTTLRRVLIALAVLSSLLTLPSRAPAHASTTPRLPPPTLAQLLQPVYFLHHIHPGDTIEALAQANHDAAWLIRTRNHLASQPLPGSNLLLLRWPLDSAHTAAITYTYDTTLTLIVAPGDSLFALARRAHLPFATFLAETGLTPAHALSPGQHVQLHRTGTTHCTVRIPAIHAENIPLPTLITAIARIALTDPNLYKALLFHESRWRMITGAAGEIGLAQIMPGTARIVQHTILGYPLDPTTLDGNLLHGALLLSWCIATTGSVEHGLALYHSGYATMDARNATYAAAILANRAWFARHPDATAAQATQAGLT